MHQSLIVYLQSWISSKIDLIVIVEITGIVAKSNPITISAPNFDISARIIIPTITVKHPNEMAAAMTQFFMYELPS